MLHTLAWGKSGVIYNRGHFYILVVVRAWTDLAENSDRWRAIVNVVMNIRVGIA
jgi:hypothetical protein